MNESSFRLALVLNGSNGTTLDKYLYGYISIVLYAQNAPQTSYSICAYLEKNYGISFTHYEITSVLEKNIKQGKIEKLGNKRNEGDTYFFTDLELKKCKEKFSKQSEIVDLIDLYFQNNKSELTKESISTLINKFVYYLFDKYKSSIIEMLCNGKCRKELVKIGDFDVSPLEREEINKFLEWDNNEKNNFFYKIINGAFNYGMLTVKKPFSTKIFEGKKFYFDTNVIIPLSGIGNKSRVEAIKKFFSKAQDLKIELCYTNETGNEIEYLLSNKCEEIKNFISNSGMIDPMNLEMFGTGGLEDFYVEYYEWYNEKKNTDLNAFHKHLYLKTQDTLSKLKLVNVDSIKYRNLPIFNEISETLSKIKKDKKGFSSQKNIEYDAVNYLFINSENTSIDNNSFLISIDKILCRFADDRKNGSMPIVINPALWLGLFLKYAGRTPDDLLAFTKFLQLPIFEHDKIELDDVLEAMKGISDDVNVRAAIFRELNYMVKDVKDFGEVDIKVMTKKAHEILIEKREAEFAEKAKKEKEELEKELRPQLEKEIKEKLENEIEEKSKKEMDERIKKRAEQRTDRKMKKWCFLFSNKEAIKKAITFIIMVIVVLVFLLTPLLSSIKDFLYRWNEDFSVVISGVIMLASTSLAGFLSNFIYSRIMKKIGSPETKRALIFKREIEKIEREVGYLFKH
jgi:hypothetical protein